MSVGVPDFQSLMLPLLRIAGEGEERALADSRARLASEFKLTLAEQEWAQRLRRVHIPPQQRYP